MLAINEKGSIKLSPRLWITILQNTFFPGYTKKRKVMKCQITCSFFLCEGCQAHAWLITKETEILRCESSTATAPATITDVNSMSCKQEQVALFDLDKESVVVCQSWGLVCSWCLKSQPQFPFLLHTRRSTRDFRMCAKLSTYSVANNTFRVSEKVLHRLPIGRHHLVLNKHAYTLILAQTSLVIIYKTGAK